MRMGPQRKVHGVLSARMSVREVNSRRCVMDSHLMGPLRSKLLSRYRHEPGYGQNDGANKSSHSDLNPVVNHVPIVIKARICLNDRKEKEREELPKVTQSVSPSI